MSQPPVNPHLQIFLRAVEGAVSTERWHGYQSSPPGSDLSVAGQYAWNVGLCEALYPTFNAVEVVLRNRVYNAGCVHFPVTGYHEVKSWLDAKPSVLRPDQLKKIAGAKRELLRELRKKNKRSRKQLKYHMTAGRLVAQLNFGFWTYLFGSEYGSSPGKTGSLWPTLLPLVFPHNPAIQRPDAEKRLTAIRQLRNRAFHHEPIWNRPNLWSEYERMKELLSWMAPEIERTLRIFDRFPQVYGDPLSRPCPAYRYTRRRIAAEAMVV